MADMLLQVAIKAMSSCILCVARHQPRCSNWHVMRSAQFTITLLHMISRNHNHRKLQLLVAQTSVEWYEWFVQFESKNTWDC